VHSCLLLTRWDVASLQTALLDDAPLFFVLTNTRGMDAARAAEDHARGLPQPEAGAGDLAAGGKVIHPILVSRSDSTLRGHYPVETDVMAEELARSTPISWCRPSSRAAASPATACIT
jgi:uncharacterized protein YgbK (DUF1537 family)